MSAHYYDAGSGQCGGISTPLVLGYVPKRELFNAMRAFLSGLELRS